MSEREACGALARRNAVAKVGAGILLSLLLLVAVDPVTPLVALVLELLVVPFAGVGYGLLLRRSWPLLVGAVSVFVITVLFGAPSGSPVAALGPFEITSDALVAGLGFAVRLLALALPGILAFATTGATELADALIQQVRVPARFAIGALAAFRLVPLLMAEWRTLTLARRARGIDAGANPFARLRLFAGTAFALLVGAIRRGTRLAVAMEARGFDAGVPRTVARPVSFTLADALVVAGAVAIVAVSMLVSVGTGTFAPLW
ncbi:ABC transporter [Virgisporangium aliadipatigenens]|uniref:ABC transporter n=1 Tax=Virgisporangium aliadipatigenens TaxID=741659 RepID=A0A8J3YNI2_9ACTN|nr:energy-coupling factor transporter transmembrane component T [Virgisporangium aliadipatigenens]GIJ47115.1 ABC transporter [Virgisporangium aliadipatigenens]